MTSPKLARATDNGRYYDDPQGGPALPSVTNCIDHGSGLKSPGLIGWCAKVTTDYAWQVLPRMVAALRDPAAREDLTREIKNQRTVVRETASDLGTRVHDYAEAHLTGRALPDDPEVAPYVEQYVAFLRDFGVDITTDVHAAEATVFNRQVGYAGTLDVLLALRLDGVAHDGTVKACDEPRLWLIDIKTSASKPDSTYYPDQTLQLAGLRYARSLLLPDDTEVPMPKVVGAAVLNLRTASYGFIPHLADPAAFEAFAATVRLTHWDAGRPKPDPKPITAAGTPKRAPRARKTTAKTTTTTTKAA